MGKKIRIRFMSDRSTPRAQHDSSDEEWDVNKVRFKGIFRTHKVEGGRRSQASDSSSDSASVKSSDSKTM